MGVTALRHASVLSFAALVCAAGAGAGLGCGGELAKRPPLAEVPIGTHPGVDAPSNAGAPEEQAEGSASSGAAGSSAPMTADDDAKKAAAPKPPPKKPAPRGKRR